MWARLDQRRDWRRSQRPVTYAGLAEGIRVAYRLSSASQISKGEATPITLKVGPAETTSALSLSDLAQSLQTTLAAANLADIQVSAHV